MIYPPHASEGYTTSTAQRRAHGIAVPAGGRPPRRTRAHAITRTAATIGDV
ncbi:hypothetical protein [Saccharopolyspora erythraea]|uniref:hypothetical protein n=1 Tax=Saccharopolyspora erythraea TaxID=1836 RepID=UPI0002DCA8FB|nr:hypothetical protein [Saccharopolyspora erythraea]QRK90440.1 hypothetical protein JQX30_02690 [Saccharopolyspora erythraea]